MEQADISVACFINQHSKLIFIFVRRKKGALRELKQNSILEAFCLFIYDNATRRFF
jgi:hypothetical protein